jgi:hypothetical protein
VPRTLHCYAAGRDGQWEAICLDLDIAVQGASFEEVSSSLEKAISLYLKSVSDLPFEEQKRLLHRHAPLRLRLQFASDAVLSLFRRDEGERYRHQYTMPMVA